MISRPFSTNRRGAAASASKLPVANPLGEVTGGARGEKEQTDATGSSAVAIQKSKALMRVT